MKRTFSAWMTESRRVEAHYGNRWTLGAWLYNAACT